MHDRCKGREEKAGPDLRSEWVRVGGHDPDAEPGSGGTPLCGLLREHCHLAHNSRNNWNQEP